MHSLTKLVRYSPMLLLIVCVALLAGCATSMTSMTDARAYEVGEVQAVVAYQASVHANLIDGLTGAAKSAGEEFDSNSDEPISEESFRTWLDTAIIFALFRPGTGPELMIRTGITDDVLEGIDVGFKTDLNILKVDAKLQFWESEDAAHAASVSLGYAHHLNVGNKVLSYLTLTDFSRSDIDIKMLYGFRLAEFVKLNVAPHLILSRITPETKVPSWLMERLPDAIKQYDPSQFFKTEWMQYYGANFNIMLGYKYAFFAFDVGMFYLNFNPTVINEERSYGGGALSLSAGLSGHYKF